MTTNKHDPVCTKLDLATLVETDKENIYKIRRLCVCKELAELREEERLAARERVSSIKGWYDKGRNEELCFWDEAEDAAYGKQVSPPDKTKENVMGKHAKSRPVRPTTSTTTVNSNSSITTTTQMAPSLPTYTFSTSAPSVKYPCDNCGKFCWEPLPMSKRAQRIYDALFKGNNPVLVWHESDDCGSRDTMRDIAETAARASKKGKKK